MLLICFYLQNKQAAGAIGAIVYDNTSDDVDTARTGKIPSLGIGFKDGKQLVDAIKKGSLYISFTNERVPAPGAYADTVSYFSSGGSNIELELRPNIAGVGGHIYSTLPSYLGR